MIYEGINWICKLCLGTIHSMWRSSPVSCAYTGALVFHVESPYTRAMLAAVSWFPACSGKSCSFFLNLCAVLGLSTYVSEAHAAKTFQTWLVLVPSSTSLLVQYVQMNCFRSCLQRWSIGSEESVWDSASSFWTWFLTFGEQRWVCWCCVVVANAGRGRRLLRDTVAAGPCTPASSGAGQRVRNGGTAASPPPPAQEGYFCGTVWLALVSSIAKVCLTRVTVWVQKQFQKKHLLL